MNTVTKIFLAIKLSCMAVAADLFYIIYRMREPVESLADAAFISGVPEMLRLMLLSAAVIAAFGLVGALVIRYETDAG